MGSDIVLSCAQDRERHDNEREQREKMDGAKGSPGADGWMKSDVPAIIIMRVAQAQPIVRCGSVPLGAKS